MLKKTTLIAIIIIIILASIIPYINAPKGYFIWDDINLILMDYQIKSWHFLKNIFSRDFFGFSDNSRKYGYYRPAVTISYMVDWKLFGKNPAGYHWTNIIYHIVNCLFVFSILLRLFKRRPLVPLIATLLFATTPIHTESVTWIAGRTDPLCGLFYFASFYFYIVYSERVARKEGYLEPIETDPEVIKKGGGTVLLLSLFFFAMSILSKEMAISLPFLIVVYNLIYISKFRWGRFSRYISSFVLFFGVAGLYFLFRTFKISLSEQAKDPYDFVTTILTFIKTISLYIWKMLFPVYLTAYLQNELVEDVFSKEFLIPFAILVILLWVFLHYLKKNQSIAFFVGFVLLSFLPLSNFIRISGPADMGFMSAERFLYIPSFGICVLLAMGFAYFIRSFAGINSERADSKPKKVHRVIALLLLAFVLVGYTTLTVLRNRDWYDNETFFKASLERAPNASILYMLLGNVYSIEQNWQKAEETLKMAIEYISPRDREEPTWIYSDLAGVYAKQGLYDKALETMKLASKTKFHNSAVEYNYGEIYRAMGNLDKAISYYERSLSIYRDNIQALVKLGMCYQQKGNYELSNKAFLNALELLPTNAEILNNIGYNYSRQGDPRKAIHYFRHSIAKDSSFSRAYANLGLEQIKTGKNPNVAIENLQMAIKLEPKLVEPRLALGGLIVKEDPEKALKIFEDAYRIQPRNIKTLLYLGLFFLESGNKEQSRKWLEKALEIDPNNVKAKQFIQQLG